MDENLPAEVAAEIESMGHIANTVVEEGLSGVPDSEVIRAAAFEQRIIVTLDKGIANVVRYPLATHCGVILFRPPSMGRSAVLSFITQRLPAVLSQDIEDRITVVTERGIRSLKGGQ